MKINQLLRKTIIAPIGLLLFPLYTFSQLTKQQVRNLTAFSKVYGYVQYFHPSDESKLGAWDNIAINGSQFVLNAKNDAELIDQLNSIFQPIAPSAEVYPSGKKVAFNLKKITPANLNGYREISWQHLGFNLFSGFMDRPYYSIKLNRVSPFEQRNDIQTPLIGHIEVSKYQGMTYEYSVEARKTDQTFKQKASFNFSDASNQSNRTKTPVNEDQNQRYHFKGKIGDSTRMISFNLKTNLGIPIALDQSSFKIIDGKNTYPIPVQRSDLNVVEAKKHIQQVVLELRTDTDLPLYEQHLNIGDYIDKELVTGIRFLMPMVLYGNDTATYPVANHLKQTERIPNLVTKNHFSKSGSEFREVRLADVIILWNILKHSFPYWQDVKVAPEKILEEALQAVSKPQSTAAFLQTIKRMSAPYQDAHMFNYIKDWKEEIYSAPISLIKIKDQIMVKDLLSNDLGNLILPGDVILELDKIPVRKKVDSLMNFFSGSTQSRTIYALPGLVQGKQGDSIRIKIERNQEIKDIVLPANLPPQAFTPGNSGYIQRNNGWINPDTYYFDPGRNGVDSNNIKILKTAKSIIFDFRGYVKDQSISTDLIEAIIKDTLVANRIFTPKILYPDYQNISYQENVETYIPNRANSITGKLVFLTDESAISAAESLLGLVKDFNLGTIMGSPTAGTNGDINIAVLPGNLVFYYSGNLVKNSDGSKHHLKGVIPDIYSTQSRESITKREDLMLLKAVEFLKKESEFLKK
ncbi:S41 family peptidase [Pedobacter gandavensis]|uniref:S41 family peptidase n=1 Tax=Pedobacter gandavensis TaxID=2679963 RepID=UPI002930585C|nr:S41 family peptidase [Pedobacter gandavensis]